MIIRPNGAPSKQTIETLSREEVKLVTEFAEWIERRGLAFDIYCRQCTAEYGPKGCRCWGNNDPTKQEYHLTCLHADRVYGRSEVVM